MLNNQIIITDGNVCSRAPRSDKGVVDAALLDDVEWRELRRANGNSTKAQMVKCAKCWELYRSEQWLKTYNLGATRVVSHQKGVSADHSYEAVEAPEHRAFNNRVFVIGDAEGFDPRKEAWASNMKTRADVLLTGTLTVAYEHQHSPFSATGRYSAPERNRLAVAVGRTVMWHATSDKIRGRVPIVRTPDGLPPEVIEDPNYRHEFRGGIYRIEIYTCTVRDGHECPDRRFSGCGKPHARGQITVGQAEEGGASRAPDLDDVVRGAPVGAYMPVFDAQVIRAPRFFWTDRKSYDQYVAYISGAPLPLLDGAPAEQARTRSGAGGGHSRLKEAELAAMAAQAVDLSTVAPPARERIVITGSAPCADDCGRQVHETDRHGLPRSRACRTPPEAPPRTQCGHWVGAEQRYCREEEGVRRYLTGMRCPAHTPAAIAGRPEAPPGPGWPRDRNRPLRS